MPVLLFTITDTALLSTVGGIIAAMAGYIIIREKAHRRETKERNELYEKENKERNELLNTQFKTISEMNETAQKNIKENTNILSGLKTLLEINIIKK